jgi:hypothetical protein
MSQGKHMNICLRSITAPLFAIAVLLAASEGQTAAKITIDDTKWVSLGAAGRISYTTTEDASPSGNDWSNDFNLDSGRIYVNGQISEHVKFEFNTECVFCGNSSLEEFVILDAIAKIEINQYFNIWAGRLLVPAERQELNGPYYSSTYDAFKTPFFPSDFSTEFGTGGAGVYARDHGINIWGAAGPEGAFQYVFGAFAGLQSSSTSGPNSDDNPLFGGRIAYNFLEVEKNPGYYTSGTYYGKGGDIFTVGLAAQYQEDGSGSLLNPGDFFGLAADVLLEKVFSDESVFTFNGEYKYFDSDYNVAAFTDGTGNFGMFDGDSYSLTALYLFPHELGIGKIQPYLRFTDVMPDISADRDEFEVGINYIIDGHNARVSLYYQHGDLSTKGLDYAPTADGRDASRFGLAIQLQI